MTPHDSSLPISPELKEISREIAAMAKIGECFSPYFSEDGKQISFISDISGIPQIWKVNTQGGWPQQITGLDDPIYKVIWSPDGQYLAFSLAPGGGMNQQIYLCDPNGNHIRRITAGGQSNNWLMRWSEDSQKVIFSSNHDNASAMEGYWYDLASNQEKKIISNSGIIEITDISPDCKFAIFYCMVNRSDDNLYMANLSDGSEILLTRHSPPGNFSKGFFSADMKTIYLSSNLNSEYITFSSIDISNLPQIGPIKELYAKPDAELENFILSKDKTRAFLIWNIAGKNLLEEIDLISLKILSSPNLPLEIIQNITISPDDTSIALTLSGATHPTDIYTYHRETHQINQITQSPHPGVSLEDLITPELLKFPSHDGLEISGWLYLPRDFSKPGPMVFSYHGGPEGQERPSLIYYYQALLRQGIAVFAPNVRGSAGFGKTFVNLDNGPLRVNAVKDILACCESLISLGIAAPGRLGIMGGSYGGYMTMAGLVEFPEVFAAGANFFGVVNFETFFAHTEPWMAEISKIQYGDPETQLEMLRELSPIHKLDKIKSATLILHGANDTNVPVIEADQINEFLMKKGLPVKYILFPDEGHGFVKTKNKITAATETTLWFMKYLGILP